MENQGARLIAYYLTTPRDSEGHHKIDALDISKLTDVILIGKTLLLDSEAQVVTASDQKDDGSGSTYFYPDDFQKVVTKVREEAPHVRVHIQTRCFTIQTMLDIAKTMKSTLSLADWMQEFAEDNRVDGFHLDWEADGWTPSPNDVRNFATMIMRLSSRLAGAVVLSLASYNQLSKVGFYSHALAHYLDFVAMMTYGKAVKQLHLDTGTVEPLEGYTRGHFDNPTDPMQSAGGFVPGPFPVSKVVIGVPFFGTSGSNAYAYHLLLDDVDPDSQREVFERSIDPRYGCSTMTISGETVYYAAKYALEQRVDIILGAGGLGVAAFKLDHDVFGRRPYMSASHDYSLLYGLSDYLAERYGLRGVRPSTPTR